MNECDVKFKYCESGNIDNKYTLEIYDKIQQQDEGHAVLLLFVDVSGCCGLAGKCDRKR